MNNISIVTGGSSGLGLAIVNALLELDHKVCIIARDEEKIQATIASLGPLGKNVSYYAGSVADEEFVINVFADLSKRSYYCNYVFNCAGVGVFGNPYNMDFQKIMTAFMPNTIGLMTMSFEALRNMTEGGTIINVMSTAALKGLANESIYCASKWAARGFTESIQAFCKTMNKNKMHVIGVYPGGMKTPFWTPNCGQNPDTSSFMDPDEVAKDIVYFVLERKTSYHSSLVIERI